MKKFKWLSVILFSAVLILGSAVMDIADVDFPKTGITAEAAASYTSGYYTYTVDSDGNATITAVDTAISGDVVIPSEIEGYAVTEIGEKAFQNCVNITEVTIPECITKIGSKAFYRCFNISTLNFNAINCSSAGGSFSYMVEGGTNNPLSPILKTINIGNKVENIPPYAFYACSQVTEIVLPESVETISEYAFAGCGITSLEIPKNVSYIGGYAFAYCASLESVEINAVNARIADIGSSKSYVFYECPALKTVTIGYDVERIPSVSSGYSSSLFYGNQTITTLNFNAKNCESTANCFYGCSNLTEINIGSGVEKIHRDTLKGTAYYNNWTEKGSNVLYIDNCLIDYKRLSSDFVIPDGTKLIAGCALYGAGCTSVTIPDSVKFIGERAFWQCNSVKEINVSENVERIDYLAFGNMRSLEKITVNSANKNYSSDSYGVLFNKDKTELIQYPVGNARQVYYVPDGVKKVYDYAFCAPLAGSSKGAVYTEGGNLVVIVLSDSVESLGEYILFYNNSLVTFYIGENSQLKSIGAHAFDYSRALENIVLPDSVESIGDQAFRWCTSLKKGLHIPSSDVTIGTEILVKAGYYESNGNVLTYIQVDICSDTENCYAKTYADENGYPFTVCDGNHTLNLDELLPEGTDEPTQPGVNDGAFAIRTPSTTTISYGDSIFLHADIESLPAGSYVEWTASNGNFDFEVSFDGTVCKITPSSSGDTTFTATAYDANGNAVSKDELTMTSKAGFFDKIIAFFKKIFGLTKILPEMFR